MSWFEVDKHGLSKLVESRGKSVVITELIQNAWDEPGVSKVDVSLEPVQNRPQARLRVEDDSADGFLDLSHAFTLYADSKKKSDPTKRGRFNLGEKLVLALCKSATVTSTTGQILFSENGTRRRRSITTDHGTVFDALLKMNREEIQEALMTARLLIPPEGIVTTVNREKIKRPAFQVDSFEASLPTLVAGEDGILKRTSRKTTVEVFGVREGEPRYLYEMGIPVVEIEDKWSINIGQKVPLNTDRDNVPPSYMKTLRVHLLNNNHDWLDEEDANSTWVREATDDERCEDDAIETVVTHRFGENRVAYDPSDPEANQKAVAQGYTLVTGSQMSKREWGNAKSANAVQPAGQLFPTPKPYSDDPNAPLAKFIPRDEWSSKMKSLETYVVDLMQEILGISITVRMLRDPKVRASAAYGNRTMDFNLAHLGVDWFSKGITEEQNALIIHEAAHEEAGNHLSEEYYEECCRLGAALTNLALEQPEFFTDRSWT